MAGIGFELKKLFRRKGLFASLRAYGYAGIICTGPMLLGVLLQLGILLLCSWAGAPRDQQDLLVCMITYTLLFSLTVTAKSIPSSTGQPSSTTSTNPSPNASTIAARNEQRMPR